MEEETQVAETEVAEGEETATTEVEGTEISEEVQEPEYDADDLPTDQAARSKLGAKVAAALRKTDTLEEMMSRQNEMMDKLMQMGGRREEQEHDPDEPLTRRELAQYLERHDQEKQDEQRKYQDGYRRTLTGLGPELEDESWTEVYNEMMTNHNMVHSGNPDFDAQLNWERAQNTLLRKRTPKREPTLKGDSAKKLGGVTEPKAGKGAEITLPTLSTEAQEYLDSVRRREGDEAADALHKSLVSE